MLLSKKKLLKIKKTKNQSQKKYKKRKKKKLYKKRKKPRSFRKRKKHLNLKNKSLKVKNIKKYIGGGMDNKIVFHLFFLTNSRIKWIQIVTPIERFREVIQTNGANSLFSLKVIQEIDKLELGTNERKSGSHRSTISDTNNNHIIDLQIRGDEKIAALKQNQTKIKITKLVYQHNRDMIKKMFQKKRDFDSTQNINLEENELKNNSQKIFDNIVIHNLYDYPEENYEDNKDNKDTFDYRGDEKMKDYADKISKNSYTPDKAINFSPLLYFSPDRNIPPSLGVKDEEPGEGYKYNKPKHFFPQQIVLEIDGEKGQTNVNVIDQGDGPPSVSEFMTRIHNKYQYEPPVAKIKKIEGNQYRNDPEQFAIWSAINNMPNTASIENIFKQLRTNQNIELNAESQITLESILKIKWERINNQDNTKDIPTKVQQLNDYLNEFEKEYNNNTELQEKHPNINFEETKTYITDNFGVATVTDKSVTDESDTDKSVTNESVTDESDTDESVASSKSKDSGTTEPASAPVPDNIVVKWQKLWRESYPDDKNLISYFIREYYKNKGDIEEKEKDDLIEEKKEAERELTKATGKENEINTKISQKRADYATLKTNREKLYNEYDKRIDDLKRNL